MAAGAGALGLLVAAGLHLSHGDAALADLVSDHPSGNQDFTAFRDSAVALVRGTDLYALRTPAALPNLGPPLLAVLLAPLVWLTPLAGYRVLVLVTLACVLGSALVVARTLGLGRGRTAALLGALAASAPVLMTLRFGQVYGLLAALLTAAWWAERRGAQGPEGVLLAVLVVLKPSLAPVLLLPLVRRQWRAVAWAAGAGAVAVLAPLLLTGGRALRAWVALLTTRADEMVLYPVNVSLPGTLARLTSTTAWGGPVVAVPGGFWLGTAAGLGAVVVSAAAARHRHPGDPALLALAAAGLLASPVTWTTYLVVLVPGVAVLAARSVPAAVVVLVPAVLSEGVTLLSGSLVVRVLLVVPLVATWVGLVALQRGPRSAASSARSSAVSRSTASPASGPL